MHPDIKIILQQIINLLYVIGVLWSYPTRQVNTGKIEHPDNKDSKNRGRPPPIFLTPGPTTDRKAYHDTSKIIYWCKSLEQSNISLTKRVMEHPPIKNTSIMVNATKNPWQTSKESYQTTTNSCK